MSQRPPIQGVGGDGFADGQVPGWDNVNGLWVPKDAILGLTSDDSSVTIANNGDGTFDLAAAGGGGASLTVQDENSNVATAVSQIDFQGAGVMAAAGTGEVIVTVPKPSKTATFKIGGVLATGVGQTRLNNDTGATWTISSIRASVETAPSGGSVTIDVNKNGTTLFTTQANRPSIATTATTSGKVTAIDVTSVADGDYLTVDVDTITSPAANLTVTVVFS